VLHLNPWKWFDFLLKAINQFYTAWEVEMEEIIKLIKFIRYGALH